MKLFGVLFAGVGLLFMAVGATLAVKQDRRIRAAAVVPAVVLSADVERHSSTGSHGRRSTTYKPVIRYRYAVEGQSYESADVFPLSTSSSRRWAESVASRFTAGQAVEAWIDPARPASAFLLKEYAFLPYIFVLFPMVFVAVGLGVGLSAGASSAKPPLPVPSAGNWHEVQTASSIARRLRSAVIVATVWDTVGAVACIHYFVVARGHYAVEAYWFAGIYALLSTGGAAAMVYYALLGRNLSDARVFMSGPRVTRGQPVTVGARQNARQALAIEQATVALACEATTKTRHGSKTSINTSVCHETSVTTMGKSSVAAGQALESSAEFTLPADAPATTPPGAKEYPRYAWAVRVTVQVAGAPDYRAKFPIVVE